MIARRTHVVLLIALVLFSALRAPAAPPAPDKTADRLEAEAHQIAAAQRGKLGDGYVAGVDASRRLVYVSALDPLHLQQTAGLLGAFTDACRKTLLSEPLKWNVTVILPTNEDFRRLVPDKTIGGIYNPNTRILTSIDRGRVLLHEFTHALHHADFAARHQRHAVWICEGLATLFEACRITPTGLRPTTDARLLTVQAALRTKTAVPLGALLRMDQKTFTAKATPCYAQARYLMYYLHQKGKLMAWYEKYKATYAADPTGRKALTEVLGRPLVTIEEDWKKWVVELQMPWGEAASSGARLGLEFKKSSRGVEVVSLLPGGAAQRAGRIHVGDIITKFNGHPIGNTGQLVGAIRAAGANQTVKVELKRHGRRLTILQPLGAATK